MSIDTTLDLAIENRRLAAELALAQAQLAAVEKLCVQWAKANPHSNFDGHNWHRANDIRKAVARVAGLEPAPPEA